MMTELNKSKLVKYNKLCWSYCFEQVQDVTQNFNTGCRVWGKKPFSPPHAFTGETPKIRISCKSNI